MSETNSSYTNLAGPQDAIDVMNFGQNANQIFEAGSPIVGKRITKIVITLSDNASSFPPVPQASGNLQAGLYNELGNLVMSSTTVAASSIANQPADSNHTFTFTGNTFVTTANSSIGIFYNYQGTNDGSEIAFAVSGGTTVEANSHYARGTPSGGNHFSNQYDLVMDVYVSTAIVEAQMGIARTTSGGPTAALQFDSPTSTPSITDRTTNDLSMQVYVNTATGQPNHQYTQLRSDANKFVAEYISGTSSPLYNQKITKVTARIYKVLSPTGSLFCRIRKGSDGSTITLGLNNNNVTPQLDVSTLGTTSAPATLYTFENDAAGDTVTGYTLTTGDRIMFELSGGTSNSTNYVQVARTATTSTVLGSNVQTSVLGTTTWTDTNSGVDDHIGKMSSGGYATPTIYPYHTLGYVNTRITQKVLTSNSTIYNQKITQVSPWMQSVGSPTGVINYVIRKGTDDSAINIGTRNATDVSGAGFAQYPVTNVSQQYTLTTGDRISLEYSGGDVNNHIRVNTNLLDYYPDGALEVHNGTSYVAKTGHDLAGQMWAGGSATDPLARTRVGEKVATTDSAIKLKTISQVAVYLRQQSGPTGNVIIRIRNSADAIVATIGQRDVTTLTSTFASYTFTSSPISVYALQVGDYVTVEYNSGNDSQFIEVMTTKTVDGFDGVVKTYLAKYDDVAWVPNTAIDLVGQFWEGGETYTPSQEDVKIPDPVYTKDLTVLAGGSPWTFIDHDKSTFDFAPSQLFINAIMPDFRFYRTVLTTTELLNIFTNRTDRGTIPLGQPLKMGYHFIAET